MEVGEILGRGGKGAYLEFWKEFRGFWLFSKGLEENFMPGVNILGMGNEIYCFSE